MKTSNLITIIHKNLSSSIIQKLLILSLLIMAATLTHARKPKMYALHINGINTTRAEAQRNLEALARITPLETNMLTWGLVWNPTGDDVGKGFWRNLTDVASQKAQEQQATMTLNDFTHYYIKAYDLPKWPESSPEFQRLRAEITNKYWEELKKAGGENLEFVIKEFRGIVPRQFASLNELLGLDGSLRNIARNKREVRLSDLLMFKDNPSSSTKKITLYENAAANDLDYVLLLPHSQGNLYANALYTYLTEIENFNKHNLVIYSIASPANQNKGDWNFYILEFFAQQKPDLYPVNTHLTSNNDFVIGGSNTLFGQALKANINIPFQRSIDWGAGHNLINVYLSDNNASRQIGKMISLELHALSVRIANNTLKSGGLFTMSANDPHIILLDPNKATICRNGQCNNEYPQFTTTIGFYNKIKIVYLTDNLYKKGLYQLRVLQHPTTTEVEARFEGHNTFGFPDWWPTGRGCEVVPGPSYNLTYTNGGTNNGFWYKSPQFIQFMWNVCGDKKFYGSNFRDYIVGHLEVR